MHRVTAGSLHRGFKERTTTVGFGVRTLLMTCTTEGPHAATSACVTSATTPLASVIVVFAAVFVTTRVSPPTVVSFCSSFSSAAMTAPVTMCAPRICTSNVVNDRPLVS